MSTTLAENLRTKSNDTFRKTLSCCTLNDIALVEESLNNIVENDELEVVLASYVKKSEIGQYIHDDDDHTVIQTGLTEEDLSTLTVPIKTTSNLSILGDDSKFVNISASGSIKSSTISATDLSAKNLTAESISTQDLTSQKHGLIGKNVDFSTGGIENLAVGHDHKFYGKESFAVHDGNKIGAVGFYWKAIDTTNHLIYLTSSQPKFNYDECHGHLTGSKDSFVNDTPGNDIPYFGPKDSSNHQELFVPDTNIDLSQSASELVGKFITVWNCKYDKYLRCFKVNSIQSKSVIKYDEVPNKLQANDLKTIYRYKDYRDNANHPDFTDNQYVVYFPDADQTKIAQSFHATSTSFGCTALGDGNTVIGYNSFASGKENRAEGNYSIALGYQAKAVNNNTFAWNGKSSEYIVSGLGQFGINPINGISGFYIGDKSLDKYIGDPLYMLDKRDGGVVSGDIGILCGNYVQVTDDKNVYNYSEKNAFIQAEEAFNGSGKSYGPAHTGSYGYCILSVVMNANGNGFKLSGNLDKLTSLTANNVAGTGIKYNPKNGCSKALSIVLGNSTDISNAMFSLALSSQGEPLAYQISSIDEAAGIVYVKQPFSSGTSALTALTEAQCKDLFDGDDNALYVPGYPEIGNLIMKTFYAQHVEGGSSRAVGKYTHAEGRDNLADVRYAHVEGAHNIAAGMASHAEGFSNNVLGRYSHVEGYLNTTKGDYSHAAGICAVADANCQYVWNGIQTHTYHAENNGTFNINPKNGMAGIYVGHHSLAEMSLPVSSLSTTVVYNNGTVSTLAIENSLLSSSIPNKKNAIDITIGNAVENIGIQAFLQCSSLTNVIIPNSVSAIQNQAFYQCSRLTGISFPDSVLAIDYSAMSKCYNLRTVKLPNKLQRLADYTFYSCSSLIDVHIPNSVSSIGQRNFDSCSKLVHVNVPNATLSIGVSAFINCPNLNSVEFEYKTMDQIANIKNYHTDTLERWGIADENAIKPYDQTYKTGYFNTNPNNGLSGFYINDKNFMQCVLSALNDTNFRSQFKSALNAIINS